MNAEPPLISVVIRSYNEAWAIGDTLKSLYSQDYPGQIDLIVIDSASTDGSHEIIRRFHPREFIILEPGTYVPGKVLNRGLALARSEWVVFLNSDATPANDQWLPELVKCAVTTPNLAAAFSRQIPRPDCQAVFAFDYERCFGPNRESVHWDHFFSMVSCIVNRAIWQRIPLREDLQYAEDDEWSRRLIAAGHVVGFAGKSVAIHSHNYTPAEARKRARGDAIAVAQAGNVADIRRRWHRDVFIPVLRDALRDFAYCAHQRRLREWPHAIRVRYNQRLGRLEGYRLGIAARGAGTTAP
jgi:rhamnosyltransferase